MSALPTNKYIKTQPPEDPKSHYEYLEQQLRSLESAVNQLVAAVKQLQQNVSGL